MAAAGTAPTRARLAWWRSGCRGACCGNTQALPVRYGLHVTSRALRALGDGCPPVCCPAAAGDTTTALPPRCPGLFELLEHAPYLVDVGDAEDLGDGGGGDRTALQGQDEAGVVAEYGAHDRVHGGIVPHWRWLRIERGMAKGPARRTTRQGPWCVPLSRPQGRSCRCPYGR